MATGEDALTVAYKHMSEEPVSPRKIRSDLPKDWESLILKALAKDPAKRYSTAMALQSAIDELITTRQAKTFRAGASSIGLTDTAPRPAARSDASTETR